MTYFINIKKIKTYNKENYSESELITAILDNWEKKERRQLTENLSSYKLKANEFRMSASGNCRMKLLFERFSKLLNNAKTDIDSLVIPEIFTIIREEFTIETKGLFAGGHAYHEFLQSIFPEDREIAMERVISRKFKNIRIIGHFDLLMLDSKGLIVVDFKTTGSKYFDYIKEVSSKKDLLQVNNYASVLNTDRFSILHINRDDFEMVEHVYEMNKDVSEANFNIMNTIFELSTNLVEKYIENGNLPLGNEIKAENAPYECFRCRFKEVCPQKTDPPQNEEN